MICHATTYVSLYACRHFYYINVWYVCDGCETLTTLNNEKAFTAITPREIYMTIHIFYMTNTSVCPHLDGLDGLEQLHGKHFSFVPIYTAFQRQIPVAFPLERCSSIQINVPVEFESVPCV